jgi:hypothetical protein
MMGSQAHQDREDHRQLRSHALDGALHHGTMVGGIVTSSLLSLLIYPYLALGRAAS